MTTRKIRTLLVDDSAVARGIVARALQSDSTIEIAGTAMHGRAAIHWMRRNPVDVVILDVEMPVMNGLETLTCIQREFPDVAVVMASTLTQAGAETTVRALAAGAAACVAKPQARSVDASIQQLIGQLVPIVRELGRKHGIELVEPVAASTRSRSAAAEPAVVVIGASTGGPCALTELLRALPQPFPAPILVVQHMPASFISLLARQLSHDSGHDCREAGHHEPIEGRRIYIAPGNHHLSVSFTEGRFVTVLTREAPEHFCRPSVNPLFRSAAETYGAAVLAVMLTGMGEDGIEGTREIARQDGYVIAQDQASSVVWGMPGAVAREDLANEVLPLSRIGPALCRVCRVREGLPT